ncbi:MFS transporter [Aquicoccus sp. SCR17]|nr:MFS transporter [Carideicomes alvinocaridis]
MTALHDTPYSWTRLAITLLISATGNVGMWAIITIMPQVEADFGIDRADAALPYTMTMVGFALGNLLIGRAVDRFGVTTALIGAAVMIAAGFALAAAAPGVGVFTLLHFIIGFGTAASFGPLMADISHWFLKRRGVAVAVAASGNYISGAFWPWALSGVLTDLGWRGVYSWLAVIVVAVVVPLALFLRRKLPAEATALSDSASAARTQSAGLGYRPLALLLGAAGIGCCVAMSMPQVHIVSYCTDLGYGPAVGAEMLSLMLLGGVASRLVSGAISDRLGGVATVLIGSTLQCLALVLYLPWDGLMPLYVVSLVFGLAQGGIVPGYAIIVREYMPARVAGTWVGFVMMSTVAGMALGGWLSGWIFDVTGSYEAAFLNGIAFNLVNIAILGTLLMRTRTPRTVAA